jgi:PAS domain S-box-containing protein
MVTIPHIRSFLEKTAEGALVTDGGGCVRFWNHAAERLFGVSSTEVEGKPCHEVLRGKTLAGRPVCSPTCSVFSRLTEGKGIKNFDIQTTTQSGLVIWLNVSSIPVPSTPKGRYLVVHLFHEIGKLGKIRQLTKELYGIVGGLGEKPLQLEKEMGCTTEEQPEIPPSLPLSKREREILRSLAEGMDTKQIADHLCISQITVRNHVQHILEKLGAHSRLEALAIVFRPRAH